MPPVHPATAVVSIGCLLLLYYLARGETWTTDDALIAFRYVDNLASGAGLVYNAGERVEGFSSALFLLLLVPARAAGISLFTAANAIGTACAIVELLLLVRLSKTTSGSVWVAAFAGILFATDRAVAVWATGGLETSMHSALVLGAFALAVAPGRDRSRAIVVAGVVHVLLAASRPEGIAFYPLYLAMLVRAGWQDGSWRHSIRRSLNVVLPGVAILLAARYAYYGSVVANPFRAKVEGVPGVWTFGAGYVEYFARRMGWIGIPHFVVWIVLLGGAAWAWRRLRATGGADDRRAVDAHVEPLVASLVYVAVGVAVVVPMGGDYMSDFRFLRPIVGIVYFAVASAVALVAGVVGALPPIADDLARRRRRTLGVALAGAVLVSHDVLQKEANPIFWDVTPARDHKRSLEVTAGDARRFRDAFLRFADNGDSILSDKSGYMGYGHALRVIDATGLLSRNIQSDFYLRPEWSEGGPRERFPGHARWPKVEMLEREHVTMIFPKLNRRSPDDAEIGPRSPRRHREYPFLHVTVALAGGEFLRFFTTLSPEALAERAERRGLPICWRKPLGALACAGPRP